MVLSCGHGVVVEVINHNRRAVAGEVKVEFQQQRADGAGCRRLAGESEEDVAVIVHEVDDVLGVEGGSEACNKLN